MSSYYIFNLKKLLFLNLTISLLFLWGCSASNRNVPANVNAEGILSNDGTDDQILVELDKEALSNYASITNCSYTKKDAQLSLTVSLPEIPHSDDSLLYLFAFEIYDKENDFSKEPVASMEKAIHCTFQLPYKQSFLFQFFVPAVLLDGEYVPVSSGRYISNPGAIAQNQDPFPDSTSKKGLLLDPTMLGTPQLTDLGVQHAIYNIPLSLILGETSDEKFPTIEYNYQGTTYYFNGAAIDSYDNLFTYLTNSNMLSTAIVLNDWNDAYPEMIHPLARNHKSGALYYAFNTAEEEGCRHLEAIATFLAKRYSGKHGLVSSWVIANEINQPTIWNYINTTDVNFFAAEFEKSLRIFYQAVKSCYANARVYFSVDHDWNNNDGSDKTYFNAKDLITAINNAARKKGNYDWGLAIHPYPDPLTRVNYWKGDYDKTMNAPLLTVMNLSAVTDFLKQPDFLDTAGNVRSITVTELGFSSSFGEKLQAAAFAYCYLILDENPYVDAFTMNRQTDATEEVQQGLAFGIYEIDQTDKYILDVFRDIDTEEADQHMEMMLNIIGAESLEEALEWAR